MNLTTTLFAIVLITTATSCAAAQNPPADKTEQGLAAQYPNDKNITNDPAVIFTADFEGDDKLVGWTKFRNRNTITTTSDPSIVHAGSASAQITATRGKDDGGALIYRWADGVDTLYFRFYCQFHKDTCHPHHFANIGANCPGRQTEGHAGSRPKGHEGFSTTIEPPSLDGEKDWTLYTYWHEMHSWQNPNGIPNTPPDGRGFYGNSFRVIDSTHFFERDKWICVEFMLKANTPGKYDGEQAVWIDGKKLMHWKTGCIEGTWFRDRFRISGTFNRNPKPFEGFNWRTDPNLKINRINLQWYVSPRALEKATVEKNIVYFDNVVIATKYIGPIKKDEAAMQTNATDTPQQGIAAAYSDDVGIADNPAVILHEDFEDDQIHERGWYDTAGWGNTLTVTNNEHATGTSALKLFYPKESTGPWLRAPHFPHGIEEIYVRYYRKWDAKWDWTGPGDGNGHDTRLVSNGPELPAQAYKANDGPVIMMESCTHFSPWHRGPFGLMLFTYSKYLTENILNSRTTLYEQGHKGKAEFWLATADKSPWPEAIPGKWYCVEYMGKMNTPGKADGQIKGWIDGKLVYDIQNVMIRDADTNNFTWRRWWVGPYFHGGTNQDQSSYIDSIVIAKKYIGPKNKN